MLHLDALHADAALRGAVAGLLLLHGVQLALPGARPAARGALGGLVASVLAYLACQRPETLLNLPRPLALLLLMLCVGGGGWLWVSARALFNDDFRWSWPVVGAIAALVLLGLAVNLPYFPDGDGPFVTPPPGSWALRLAPVHAAGMLGFTVAALWEVARGWQADLVATRRAARRWAAMGIGLYALLALVVELALRDRPVGPLLPALHVAGIGLVALALAVGVGRHSLDALLGVPPEVPPALGAALAVTPGVVPAVTPAVTPAEPSAEPMAAAAPAAAEAGVPPPSPTPVAAPAPVLPPPDPRTAEQLGRLQRALVDQRLHRQEGLTLAGLASQLGLPEATLRSLINQRLGFRNFNDFLHHHRLQDAAQRLAQVDDLPILSIALDCGYGSIGPFNRAFKQRLGMTPSDYRAAARVGRGRSQA